MTTTPRTLSTANRDALMLELHKLIEETADDLARNVVDGTLLARPDHLSYPPNSGFTQEELTALRQLAAVPGVESVLRKILASAGATPLFHLMVFIDGVGDPASGDWSGVSLLDKAEGDHAYDFLHDSFYEYYWGWRAIRPDKGWRLGTYDGPAPVWRSEESFRS